VDEAEASEVVVVGVWISEKSADWLVAVTATEKSWTLVVDSDCTETDLEWNNRLLVLKYRELCLGKTNLSTEAKIADLGLYFR